LITAKGLRKPHSTALRLSLLWGDGCRLADGGGMNLYWSAGWPI